MLRSTFAHIKGLSGEVESKLWTAGILDWKDIGNIQQGMFSDRKISSIHKNVAISEQAFVSRDLKYFAKKLPRKEAVRLYPHIAGRVAYIDIETTGLDRAADISTIALYDGKDIHVYVNGINMNDFTRQAERYDFVVTYNGARFDLPFLSNRFGGLPDWTHIDLCSVLHAWGYYGGLKMAERAFRILRDDGMCADGLEAVHLWYRYRATRNKKYLSKLLEYNVQDVLSLESIFIELYNRSMNEHPMHRKTSKAGQSDVGLAIKHLLFEK